MGLINKTALRLVGLFEDAIERLGDPHGSQTMRDALVVARDRAATLALEKAQLEDQVETLIAELNELRDRRIVLYRDEVEAISYSFRALMGVPKFVQSLEHLLYRSQHDRRTFEEAHRRIHAVIMGRTFDPEECPADTSMNFGHGIGCKCPECRGETDGNQ